MKPVLFNFSHNNEFDSFFLDLPLFVSTVGSPFIIFLSMSRLGVVVAYGGRHAAEMAVTFFCGRGETR